LSVRKIGSLQELQGMVGQEVGVSPWLDVSQRTIDQFAEVTGDHQWIHVDPVRAAAESPFGGAIAHGFLTLSLLPRLVETTLSFGDWPMGVNYGFNRLRFVSPVPAGRRIRGRFKLDRLDQVDGTDQYPLGVQMTWGVTIEIEGQQKPALAAEWLTWRYR
jgi:acyl dehydratase